jgi:predicted nucleotidyltransferase
MDYGTIIRHLCHVFNKNSVEYMIVGGTAVALHGYYRKSITQTGKIVDKPDLDFWYNPTYPNYFNLLNGLEELGKDVREYREEQTPDPRTSIFRLDFPDYTLDILPAIKAQLSFRTAFARRQSFMSSGVAISFISLEDLIQDKLTDSRPKDIEDIENLKKNNPAESDT